MEIFVRLWLSGHHHTPLLTIGLAGLPLRYSNAAIAAVAHSGSAFAWDHSRYPALSWGETSAFRPGVSWCS
jgi:hypothetical protein